MMARSYSFIICNKEPHDQFQTTVTHVSILAAFENFRLNFIIKKQTAKGTIRTLFHNKHSAGCGTIHHQGKQQHVSCAERAATGNILATTALSAVYVTLRFHQLRF